MHNGTVVTLDATPGRTGSAADRQPITNEYFGWLPAYDHRYRPIVMAWASDNATKEGLMERLVDLDVLAARLAVLVVDWERRAQVDAFTWRDERADWPARILATADPYAAAEEFVDNGWTLAFATPKDSGDPLGATHQTPGPVTERAWGTRSFAVQLAGYNFMIAAKQD